MINLSVIIPVYKVPPEYLHACLDSLEAQASQNCEFIVVSDGASDTECSICEEYASKDSRFKFFKREHTGVSAARNFGIEQAQGEYITFVDSDDWIDSCTCKECEVFLRQTSCDILIFSFTEHYPNGSNQSHRLYPSNKEKISEKELHSFERNTIHLAQLRYLPVVLSVCKIYKRSFLVDNHIVFDDKLSIGEDRVFNFRVFNKAKQVAYLNRPFYHYIIHPSSSRNRCDTTGIQHSLLYLNELKELSQGHYNNELGLEAISEIWVFTRKCPLKKEFINALKNNVLSNDFQNLVQNTHKFTRNPLMNLDIWAFKRQMTFTIHLHLAISAIQRNFRKIFRLN